MIDSVNRALSCYTPVPMGAFYKVAKLPVVGETIMQASAAGFYTSPDLGKDQVRLAYVLCKEDL